MRIAIVGIGVAGSYLLSLLKKEHDVVGFERMDEVSHDSICAWGTSKNTMQELCSAVDIDFNKFIIHDGKNIYIDMTDKQRFDIKLKGICTYDKIGLIQQMAKGCKIHYSTIPKLKDLESDFDLIVDATGFHRNYLPKIKNDFYLPTFQYKVYYEHGVPLDDFYIRPFSGMSGYLWYFPLGDKWAHIGAGDYKKQHVVETRRFFEKYGGTIHKTVGRPIRLATPDRCTPFNHGKVVGVGESIGTVYPLLGEGIIPSMYCAKFFVNNLTDMNAYRKDVLNYFAIYSKVYDFITAKMCGKFNMLKQMPSLLAIFRYMKKNEDRFGMEIHLKDLWRVSQA